MPQGRPLPLDSAADLTLMVTANNHIFFACGVLLDKLGYSAEELVDVHILDLCPVSMRPDATAKLAAALRGEQVTGFLMVVARDDVRIPVEVRLWSGRWCGAKCIMCVGKDLSAERKGRKHFEHLFHRCTNPMLLSIVPDKRFWDVNGAFLSLLGYSRGEIIGKTAEELRLFANPEQESAVGKILRAEARVTDFEIQVRGRGCEVFDAFWSGMAVSLQGQVFFLNTISLVTAPNQSKATVLQERDWLRDVVENTITGTWEWNVPTGETVFNDSWAEIAGYTLAELSPVSMDTWEQFIHPDDLRRCKELLQKHFSGESGHYLCEARIKHRNGHWVWVVDSGRVLSRTADGGPSLMFGTRQNIIGEKQKPELVLQLGNGSARPALKQQAARNAMLYRMIAQQSRVATTGEMLNNIADQWRQPLTALGLVVANIQDAFQSNEMCEAFMNQAVGDANRIIHKLSATINDFQSIFDNNKKLILFSLREQILATVALVEPSFRNEGISIRVNTPQDMMQSGIPNEYSQVLLNLLTNARDAIVAYDVLRGRIEVSLLERMDSACVTVRDNGGGIPPAIFARIFEPGFSTKPQARGMGLKVSETIMGMRMNGRVEARNIPGGAELAICTPCHRQAVGPMHTGTPPFHRTAGRSWPFALPPDAGPSGRKGP